MEGLGVAASVVAVTTIGLQSLRLIYQTLREIKHGSKAAQKLVLATEYLSKFLEQIKGLAQRAKETLGEHEAKFFENLEPLLSESVGELNLIRKKLDKFTAPSNHRLWNNVKIFIHEKDVEEMWRSVRHYLQLFESQLSNAGVNVILLNTEGLELIGNAVTAVSCDINQRFDSLEMFWGSSANQVDVCRQDIISALDVQFNAIEAAAGHQSEKLDGIQSNLTELNSLANESLTKSDRLESLLQVVESFSDKFEGVTSMSAAQSSQIRELTGMMKKMQLEMQEMRHDPQRSQHGMRVEDGPSRRTHFGINSSDSNDLYGSFERPCNLATAKGKEVYSKEAQSIIQDLKRLVASLLVEYSISIGDIPDESMENGDQRASYEAQNKDVLHKIENILGASRRLRISEQGSSKTVKRPACPYDVTASKGRCSHNDGMDDTRVVDHNLLTLNYEDTAAAPNAVLRNRSGYSHHRKGSSKIASKSPWTSATHILTMESVPSSELKPSKAQYITESSLLSRQTILGRIDVQFKEQWSLVPCNRLSDPSADEDPPEELVSARVILTPASRTGLRSQVTLEIAQALRKANNILTTPMLSFRSIVPYTSEIFDIVRYGSIIDLQKAISEGKASTTDCDPNGRSLLNYALYALRPTMAKFLIQAGADVNSLEKDYANLLSPSFGWFRYLDIECSMRKRFLKTECQRVLLANDADPSLMMDVGDGRSRSQFACELSICSLASLRAILDLGCPFISPNSTEADHIESSPLLILAWHHSSGYSGDCETPDKVALLLARGADVNQRDPLGNTCLHIVMDGNGSLIEKTRLEFQTELKDILMLMITAGADVQAVNDNGDTVSYIADEFGHYQIWAEALEACGYDVEKTHQETNVGLGRSSAVENLHTGHSTEWTSKLSFADYVKQRQTFCRSTEVFDYENAEEEYVQEELRNYYRQFQDEEESEEEQEDGNVWDRDTGSVAGSSVCDDESSEEGNGNEEMWSWNEESGDISDHEKNGVETSDQEGKWD